MEFLPDFSVEDLDVAVPLIEKNHHRLVAIGEVGLDFTPFWCKTEADKDGQRCVLKAQVDFQTIILNW